MEPIGYPGMQEPEIQTMTGFRGYTIKPAGLKADFPKNDGGTTLRVHGGLPCYCRSNSLGNAKRKAFLFPVGIPYQTCGDGVHALHEKWFYPLEGYLFHKMIDVLDDFSLHRHSILRNYCFRAAPQYGQ